MKLLIIDNYDSFVYNIVYVLKQLGITDFTILKNDAVAIDKVKEYTHILISPGPGVPQDAGCIMQIIDTYQTTHNILGVCLGHQAIGAYFGWPLKCLTQPLHGIASPINILKEGDLFKGIPNQTNIGHYHSWVIEPNDNAQELEVLATDYLGNVMAIKHKQHKLYGLQFHPESILTAYGKEILNNWIKS